MKYSGYFCVFSMLLLSACDNVDISKYPQNVQNCYNQVIYDVNNCTKSKKAILNYCQCYTSNLAKKTEEINANYRQASAGLNFFNAGSLNSALRATSQATLNQYATELVKDCASKTGYTPIAECKK